jgi:hypothetical protein
VLSRLDHMTAIRVPSTDADETYRALLVALRQDV